MVHQTQPCVTFLATFFILCSQHRATALSCYLTDVINATRIVTAECDAEVKSCLNITIHQDVLDSSRGIPNYSCGPEYIVPPGCHSNTVNNTRITVCSCYIALCNGEAQERPEGEPDVGRIKEGVARSEPEVGRIKGRVARSKPDKPRSDKHPAKTVPQCYKGHLMLPKIRKYFGLAEYVALLTKQTELVSCDAPKMCLRSVSEFQDDADYHLVMDCRENPLPVAEKRGCHIERHDSIRTQFCYCLGDHCNNNLGGLPADGEEWARNMATVLPWTHEYEPKVLTEMRCHACRTERGEYVQCKEETCVEGVKICEKVNWKGVTKWGCAKDNLTMESGCQKSVKDHYTFTRCYCDTHMCNDDVPVWVTTEVRSFGHVLTMSWKIATVPVVFLIVFL